MMSSVRANDVRNGNCLNVSEAWLPQCCIKLMCTEWDCLNTFPSRCSAVYRLELFTTRSDSITRFFSFLFLPQGHFSFVTLPLLLNFHLDSFFFFCFWEFVSFKLLVQRRIVCFKNTRFTHKHTHICTHTLQKRCVSLNVWCNFLETVEKF